MAVFLSKMQSFLQDVECGVAHPLPDESRTSKTAGRGNSKKNTANGGKFNSDRMCPVVGSYHSLSYPFQLKARAQSSGATPGEIIRNALPAEEYQTTDQRACYTRCIQRFRKSLQRKNSKSKTDAWQGKNDEKNLQKLPTTDEDNTWKPVVPLTDPVIHETKHWHGNPGVPLGQMVDGKDLVQNKMELFGI